jgi:hypothetical protein
MSAQKNGNPAAAAGFPCQVRPKIAKALKKKDEVFHISACGEDKSFKKPLLKLRKAGQAAVQNNAHDTGQSPGRNTRKRRPEQHNG